MNNFNTTAELTDVSEFFLETDDFTLSCITKTPEEKEKPPVLIENILYKGHSMLFYGPSKSFKSFLLLMLALAIATGGEWLGFKCSQGNVLIIEFENGQAMTYDRLKLILDENNIDKKYLSRISIVTLKKRADINTLVDGLIKNIPPEKYSAIIIDPIYKLLSGGESQAEIVDSVFARIDELSKALDASVIVCHHTKKEGQTNQNFIDKISGSSLMGRNMAALVGISSVSKKDNYKRERIEMELRHFPQQPSFYININGASYSREDKKDSSEAKPAPASKDVHSEKSKDLIRFYNFLNNMNGTVKISQLEELMQMSKNTVKKYIDETPGFKRDDNGNVTYTELKEII